MEMRGGTLTQSNIPLEILNAKKQKIELISLEHLIAVQNGFLLLFNVNYSNYRTLVVSTIDSQYCIVDFKVYPNFYAGGDTKQDTIAIPWFNSNHVTIELMNPNKENRPTYETDGLWKENLLIKTNLKLELKEQTARKLAR